MIDHAQNYFLSQPLQVNDQMMEMKLGSDRGEGDKPRPLPKQRWPHLRRRSAKMETTSDEESEGKPAFESIFESIFEPIW